MTGEEYLQSLLAEIENAKLNGRKGVYKIDEKIPDSTVKYIQKYFADKSPEFRLETRKCARCRHTWDILVIFGT